MSMIQVNAFVEPDATEGKTRYSFELTASSARIGAEFGEYVTRRFIVDIPEWDNETTDVWVLNQTVQVGDTPADGFATFTPVT